MKRWSIININDVERAWDNQRGWVDATKGEGDTYSDEEKATTALPIDGCWEENYGWAGRMTALPEGFEDTSPVEIRAAMIALIDYLVEHDFPRTYWEGLGYSPLEEHITAVMKACNPEADTDYIDLMPLFAVLSLEYYEQERGADTIDKMLAWTTQLFGDLVMFAYNEELA